MPTHRSPQAKIADLVNELAKCLGPGVRLEQPFLLQDRIPQTRARHVVVIWDRWSAVEKQHRSKVIVDAYEQAGLLGDDTITVAMGITQEEALEMGFLPYSIGTMRRRGDPVSEKQLRQALQSVGGVRVAIGSSLQVRFPTKEHAQEAYRKLCQDVQGPYWEIIEERQVSG
jgi:hypothetical protein